MDGGFCVPFPSGRDQFPGRSLPSGACGRITGLLSPGLTNSGRPDDGGAGGKGL